MQFGIIGSGSWATALAKVLTGNHQRINWHIRNAATIAYIQQRGHNPHYLAAVHFNTAFLTMSNDAEQVIKNSDALVIAVPSAFIKQTFAGLPKNIFHNKKIISAVKGIMPDCNELLNDYLVNNFGIQLQNYFTVLGPCHAEEIAAEKLSYLTFSGIDESMCKQLAACFSNNYVNTIINGDIAGVQYAAVLKNIYALGAGIAHGLDYGDNFLSVYIANCAHEMMLFLQKLAQCNDRSFNHKSTQYTASVYLGDLLVTCYSLYSRNRMFGAMIGKGYSAKAAQLELNMVAEGYNASKCIFIVNKQVFAAIPIIEAVYEILWQHAPAKETFKRLEASLV